MKPTTLGFYGVGETKLSYEGILYDLELQLADGLKASAPVAVFPNQNNVMLLGNDLLGGPNAKFQIVMMCATHSAYLLCDNKGATGVVHYLKNVEGANFPVPPVANTVQQPSGASQVTQLFR